MNLMLKIPRRENVEPLATLARSTGKLEVRGLSKRYGPRAVLQDINLDLHGGEAVAIVGRSGCGKSTLLRVLSGIEKTDTGGVWIDEQSVTQPDPRVRVMFQESRLLPWKRVIENVRLGLSRHARARAADVLDSVGLAARQNDWPAKLSGGQQQRVALARALAPEPEILLLDEPLGALDALTRLEMQALIERLWRERAFTLVLVTHDVEEALVLADRIFVMENGHWSAELEVGLARPRDRSDPEFVRRRETVLDAIMHRSAVS